MTTTVGNRGPTRLEERLAWAREVLQVEEDAAPAEVRRKFLRDLQEQQFVPTESASRAFQTLRFDADGIADVEDPHEFLLAEERQLQDEVDEFARQMFRWPLEQRKRLWIQLRQRCEHALRPQARLHALAAGLKTDPASIDIQAPLVKELADYVCQLFTLRPAARAQLRNEIRARIERLTLPDVFDNEDNPQAHYKTVAKHVAQARAKWENAARVLQSRQPEFAALDSELVTWLANWCTEQQRMNKTQPAPRRQPRVATRQLSGGAFWWISAVALGLFLFLSHVSTQTSNSSHYPSYEYNNYDPPASPNVTSEFNGLNANGEPFIPRGAPDGTSFQDPAKRREQLIEEWKRQAEKSNPQQPKNLAPPYQIPPQQRPKVNPQPGTRWPSSLPSYRPPSPNTPSYRPPARPSPGTPASPFK